MAIISFDLGANNGDDTNYLLIKGYDVVAVEANPILCEDMRGRFHREINSGRLRIVNAAVGWKKERRPFFVHLQQSVRSKLVLDPQRDKFEDFREIEVDTISIADLVQDYGLPLYLKSDLEGFDTEMLNQMIQARIRPQLISVEIAGPITLSQLHVLGYQRFFIQNCATIETRYRSWLVKKLKTGKLVRYSFPEHSSGPCGDDLHFPYYDVLTAMSLMPIYQSAYGRGWHDLHAWAGPTNGSAAQIS